ncbi:hypothetical protein K439DRAFT_1635170 [Ramaria rubella]|nr:hypothetical protein K439DRAFT_1642602 [Ramaria rubella]KAF8582633.1 hypothetical protein K439DRAFT_1635170 [Ramaria rubella]
MVGSRAIHHRYLIPAQSTTCTLHIMISLRLHSHVLAAHATNTIKLWRIRNNSTHRTPS